MAKSPVKLKIEKGIPVPSDGAKNHIAYTIRRMQKGDSFVWPKGRVPNGLYATAKAIGMKLTSRKLQNGNSRFWRIK